MLDCAAFYPAPANAVVVDDATESVHGVRVRERATPHLGGDPSASGARG